MDVVRVTSRTTRSHRPIVEHLSSQSRIPSNCHVGKRQRPAAPHQAGPGLAKRRSRGRGNAKSDASMSRFEAVSDGSPVGGAVVTGAAGFIGCHLAARLVEQGWAVRGVDNERSGDWRRLTVPSNA